MGIIPVKIQFYLETYPSDKNGKDRWTKQKTGLESMYRKGQ